MGKRSRKVQKRKRSLKYFQNKIWSYCKKIIRKKYGNTCYTCGAKNLEGQNWHTGHLWPKAILSPKMKYDLRVLRPQCGNCNNWNDGMGAEFLRLMILREPEWYITKLQDDKISDKQVVMGNKEIYDYYEFLESKYKLMLEEL